VNGGSQHPDKRRAGGHGPTLADQVEHLLPTPRTGDNRNSRVALTGSNSDKHGRTAAGSASGLGLEQAIEMARGETPRELLLPTPNAEGGTGYMSGSNRDTWRPTLEGAARGYVPVLHQGRPTGEPMARQLLAGSEPSDDLLPLQLSLDELESA
jgi:hypothetical protein